MTQTPYSATRPDGSGRVTPPDATPSMVGQAQEKVGQVAEQAKGAAEQVAEQAKGAAGQVAEQAKGQATSQLESQKTRAVDSLVTVAQALRQTGQHLNEQDQGTVGRYVDMAAERMESVTNYMRSHDVPELLAETQELARRQPGLFLTGALALGFVGARFLMSSGQRATAQRSVQDTTPNRPMYATRGALQTPTYDPYSSTMRGTSGGLEG